MLAEKTRICKDSPPGMKETGVEGKCTAQRCADKTDGNRGPPCRSPQIWGVGEGSVLEPRTPVPVLCKREEQARGMLCLKELVLFQEPALPVRQQEAFVRRKTIRLCSPHRPSLGA